ncbi:hypothetical protein CG473_02790 [Mycoplasma testudineum]|nr:hypothetical protein CG473_02790 [Mycoplasma testudineum]
MNSNLKNVDFSKQSILILPTLITSTSSIFTNPELNISFYESVMFSSNKITLNIITHESSLKIDSNFKTDMTPIFSRNQFMIIPRIL